MTHGTSTIGFHEYVRLNLLKPIEEQLRRRRLFFRQGNPNDGNPNTLKKIIEENASLKIDFGWSFESEHHYRMVMNDCISAVTPNFNEHVGNMTTDGTCSWVGFVPHNVYDKEVYKELSTYGLIIFNNEIIDFQIKVAEFVTSHHIFRQHAFMRDDWYRFATMKAIRKDRAALAEAYRYYMDAVHEISLVNTISRDLLEEQIGCHYLYHPDLFFELLEFSILKGEVDG